MVENARGVDAEFDAHEALQKIETPQLRNEAQLNCVSLRSALDDEVTWGVVKGQMNVPPTGTPLTAPQVTTGGLCISEKN
jgi:hypothetical protein